MQVLDIIILKYFYIVNIRTATLQDLPQILALFENTIKSICKDDYTPEQIEVWTSSVRNTEKWENRIQNQHFIVAELNNIIVGFCSLKNDYLDVLYVHKEYLRQGIADKLYADIESKALSINCKTIIVDASITAKPFFIKQGFEIVKENKNLIKGIEIINYNMKKKLV